MATPTVYVICDQNCKFESMTKEQILAAIAQAVSTGEIKDVDAGFVQTIKTINGLSLKFFYGEQSAYDALTEEEKANLFAIITNDTTRAKMLEDIETLQKDVEELGKDMKRGELGGVMPMPAEAKNYFRIPVIMQDGSVDFRTVGYNSSKDGMVPMFRTNGALVVGTATEEKEAVNLGLLNSRLETNVVNVNSTSYTVPANMGGLLAVTFRIGSDDIGVSIIWVDLYGNDTNLGTRCENMSGYSYACYNGSVLKVYCIPDDGGTTYQATILKVQKIL